MRDQIRDRIRDAILVVTVGSSLFATAWAFHDPAENRPEPKVHTTPATAPAPDPSLH